MDLKEEDILGDKIHSHWYYISKGRAVRALLGCNISVDEILDVGAGSGVFSRQFIDHNICQNSVCVDPGYVEEREEIYNNKSIRFVRSIDQPTQNLILMMDVLEHVPDDVALLKKYTKTMSKGGKVLITVPAFQFVWSGHDVFLEHYRRYTIKRLEKVVLEAGLTPVKSRYFFATKFPIVAAIRLFKNYLLNHGRIVGKSELRLYPEWFNKTLIFVHDVERILIYPFNRIFGLSVIMICEKK